jgi:hypothetical protein
LKKERKTLQRKRYITIFKNYKMAEDGEDLFFLKWNDYNEVLMNSFHRLRKTGQVAFFSAYYKWPNYSNTIVQQPV